MIKAFLKSSFPGLYQRIYFPQVRFGKHVVVKNKFLPQGPNSIDHFSVLEGGRISLGQFATVSSHCVLRGPIRIGSYTQLGPNVQVFSRNHPVESMSINASSIFMEGRRKKLQADLTKEVIIGNDVWVGAGVVILPGSEIPNGCVIAAGAVVRGKLEPYTIYGGIPAKPLKKRFNPELAAALEQSKWWTLPQAELEQRYGSLLKKASISVSDFTNKV